MVRKGVVAADIGTDHAYLPSYLVLTERCPRAIACDLRQKPLNNAKESLERYSLCDKIELRLSDGLDALQAGDAQDIIMTGMGGILISKIIDRAPWVRDHSVQLVLQPMTHAEDIRGYLCRNGFEILKECACEDDGRVYTVINARFSGESREYPAGYEYYGELDSTDELARRFVKKQYNRIKKRAVAKAGLDPAEAERCERLCRGMADFLKGE